MSVPGEALFRSPFMVAVRIHEIRARGAPHAAACDASASRLRSLWGSVAKGGRILIETVSAAVVYLRHHLLTVVGTGRIGIPSHGSFLECSFGGAKARALRVVPHQFGGTGDWLADHKR